MEMTSPAEMAASQGFRPLKRVEYDRLAAEGFFENEKVELLFGVVVEMTPMDPAHIASTNVLRRLLEGHLGARATVLSPAVLAASEISEPEPDLMVVPAGTYWDEHPEVAYLVIEIARSSVARDQGIKAVLYGSSAVEEYWIVNHVDDVVEVYRDRHDGTWRSKVVHGRGECIAMARFPDVEIAVSDILPPAR